MNLNPKLISLGVAAGLMYLAWSGRIKDNTAKTAAIAVAATVLVRNTRPTPGHNDAGKLYDLNGDGVPDFTCVPGPNCSFKRHVFSQSFQVRNVAQRRGA